MNPLVSKVLQNMDRIFHRAGGFEREKPQNPNELARKQLSFQDKIALSVTSAVGTMYAVYFFAFAMAGWMFWQQGVLHEQAFDPYPFAFLLFIGNIVQLLLMPLIMVSQNIQGRHAELRAEEQYKTTVSSYHDTEYMMDHLAAIDTELLRHRQLLMDIATQLGTKIPTEMNAGITVPITAGANISDE